ncbi:hypothetical protein [Flavobacterium sp. W21_SRS_FM6]|uniref:hypothetical protein n=1 Tax=Flavobacterium sp. W21_SRS_FM6 TaxID=3240268 RepID=UPI003F915EDF
MNLVKDAMGKKKQCGAELSKQKQTKAKDIEPQTTPLWGTQNAEEKNKNQPSYKQHHPCFLTSTRHFNRIKYLIIVDGSLIR